MSRNYINVSAFGQILSAGFSDIQDTAPLPAGAVARVFLQSQPPSLDSHYWDGSAVKPMGEPPSEAHRFDYKTKTWTLDTALAWKLVRQERDRRLSDSDWVVLWASDQGLPVPPDWLAYRQALRDITNTTTGPLSVVWPREPAPPAKPVVPPAVTMRQARLALLGAGLLAPISAAIASMPGSAGEAARIEWEFASTVERNNPLILSLTSAMGMTDAQIDALFIAAAAIA